MVGAGVSSSRAILRVKARRAPGRRSAVGLAMLQAWTRRRRPCRRPPPPPVVAYSGEPGAFAEDAVRAYFGEEIATLPIGGFRGVFEAVADGRAVAGVVPIENVVNGTVRENYDLLLEFAARDPGRGGRARATLPRRAPGGDAGRDRARLLARPGAGPGRRLPAHPAVDAPHDVQHGRRREGDRRAGRARARRPSSRRAPRRSSGCRGPRRRHPGRSRQPDPLPGRRASGGRRCPRRSRPPWTRPVPPARRSSWGSGTSRAPSSGR